MLQENDSTSFKTFSNEIILCLGCFVLLLLRLWFITISDNYDADAITKIWHAKELSQNFHLLTRGTWAPLIYLVFWPLGFLPGNFESWARVVSVFFSTATVAVIVYYVREVFGKSVAILCFFLLAIHPLGTFVSQFTVSENLFAFFFFSSLLATHFSLKINSKKCAFASGVLYTIASGIRFESWPLMVCIVFCYLYHRQYQNSIAFLLPALIFPLYWCISSFWFTGNPFFSFEATRRGVQVVELIPIEGFYERLGEYFRRTSHVLGFGFLCLSFAGILIRPWRAEKIPFVLFYKLSPRRKKNLFPGNL